MDQLYGEAGDDVLYAADGGDLLRGGTGNDSYNVRRVDYDALISLDVPTYTLFDEAGALDRLYLWDDGQMNLNGLEDLSFRAVGSDLWIDLDIDLTLDDDDEGRIIVKNQANPTNALESLYLADKNGVVFGSSFALTSVWSALLANGSDDWFRMSAPASGSDPSAIAIVPGSGTGGSGAGNTQGGANTLSLDAPLVLRGQVGQIGASISYTITPAMKGAIQLELDLAWTWGDAGEVKTYRVDVLDASQTLLESFRINGDKTFRVGVVGPTAHSIRLTNTGDTREIFNVLNGQFTLTVRQADTSQDYESERNDWRTDADPIALGRTNEGQLSNSLDVDWYRVIPSQAGALQLSFSDRGVDSGYSYAGSGAYKIEVTDAAGIALEAFDFDYVNHLDATWRAGVASTAVHYVKVSHDPSSGAVDTGWYRLNVTQAPTDIDYESEHNGTRALAETMTLGRTIEGQLSTAADVDWYRITPGQVGALDVSFTDYINNDTGGSDQFTIEVTDSSGTVLEAWANTSYQGSGMRIGIANTAAHFIKVSHDPASGAIDTGWYHLNVTQAPSNIDYESERNDTRGLAEAMTIGRVIEGQLSTDADVDWYRIVPGQVGALDVSFTDYINNDTGGSDQFTIEVTDSSGTVLETWANTSYQGSSKRIAVASTAERFIKVSHDPASGAVDTGWYHLTATSINFAPSLAQALPDFTLNEDVALNRVIPATTFADPGDTLVWSATLGNGAALPAWLRFNPTTRALTGRPGNAEVGRYEVKILATDAAGATGSDSFSLTVANLNDAPRLVLAAPDRSINEDAAFSFALPGGTFADDDAGDALTYSARLAGAPTLPAWLNFDPRTLTFSGTPGNANVGPLDVRVVATDRSLASLSDDFRLTVVNVNDTPLTAARVVTTNEDSPLTFRLADFPFADEDAGDGLTKVKFLSWPVTGTLALAGQAIGPFTEVSAADLAAGRLTYLPGTDVTGDVALNFAVSDGKVYSATAALTIRITAVNDAPRLVAPLRDQVATTHAAFQFQIPTGAFADVEANPISYGATLADGTPLPGWLGFNPATGLFSGTPKATDAGRLDVQVTASDWFGASATDQFSLQIDPEYGATTATAGRTGVGVPVTSLIDRAGDTDWFAVSLNAGSDLHANRDRSGGGDTSGPGGPLCASVQRRGGPARGERRRQSGQQRRASRLYPDRRGGLLRRGRGLRVL